MGKEKTETGIRIESMKLKGCQVGMIHKIRSGLVDKKRLKKKEKQ